MRCIPQCRPASQRRFRSVPSEDAVRITPSNPAEELRSYLEGGVHDPERDIALSLKAADQAVAARRFSEAGRIMRAGLKRAKRDDADPLTLARIHSALADVARLEGGVRKEIRHRRLMLQEVERVYGAGALETEFARMTVAASFSRGGARSIIDHTGARLPRDLTRTAMRYAARSRKNLESALGAEDPAARFAKAFEARVRTPVSGPGQALKTFEDLLDGGPGEARYAGINDLKIESMRLDLLAFMRRDDDVEAIQDQFNRVVVDRPAVVLLQDFDHRALVNRSEPRGSAPSDAGSSQAGGPLGAPVGGAQHPPSRFRDSWVDVSFCVGRDGHVADIAVQASGGHDEWARRVRDALRERRYAAWRPDAPAPNCIARFERIAAAVGAREVSGPRTPRTSAFSEVIVTDLYADDGPLGTDFRREKGDLGDA